MERTFMNYHLLALLLMTLFIMTLLIMTIPITLNTVIGSDISIKSLKRKTKHQRRLQFNQHVKRAF
jgi:hypothetical protein